MLVNLVHNLDHVARDARRAHVAHNLRAGGAGRALRVARRHEAPVHAEDARDGRGLGPVEDADAALLVRKGVARQVVVRQTVGARPAAADAARVKRQDLVVPAAGPVERVAQPASRTAAHAVDAGAPRPARVGDDGAAKGRVRGGHDGRQADDGQHDEARVGGGVLPVHGHRQARALVAVVAGPVREDRGGRQLFPVKAVIGAARGGLLALRQGGNSCQHSCCISHCASSVPSPCLLCVV